MPLKAADRHIRVWAEAMRSAHSKEEIHVGSAERSNGGGQGATPQSGRADSWIQRLRSALRSSRRIIYKLAAGLVGRDHTTRTEHAVSRSSQATASMEPKLDNTQRNHLLSSLKVSSATPALDRPLEVALPRCRRRRRRTARGRPGTSCQCCLRL
jgi:hypothetical protein